MNKKYDCIIIDDNPQCISALKQLLDNYFPEMNILGFAHSVKDGVQLIKEQNPAVVFLDVEMPLEDGTKIFEYIDEPEFETIFTTSFEDYAPVAFRLNSLDYLVKPIKPSELNEAIRRLKQKLEPKMHTSNFKLDQNVRISFAGINNIEVFTIADILYCKAENNYTTIFSRNKKATASKTLMHYEEQLLAYGFFRVNRSHLVNLNYVDSVDKSLNGEVVLTDKTRLSLSGRRKKAFLEQLNLFLQH